MLLIRHADGFTTAYARADTYRAAACTVADQYAKTNDARAVANINITANDARADQYFGSAHSVTRHFSVGDTLTKSIIM